MKDLYLKPEAEVVSFCSVDVVASSLRYETEENELPMVPIG